ncbi:acetolactate decarboxylase [Thermoleophilia bacterium SCSIO 60948]|nr:acetolactate decarboxylase [Thermoleophilia bacterium SCSIO 60948]
MLDDRLIASLHLRAERRDGVSARDHDDEIFQTSTIQALLDGRFEGDLSFAELAGHGDLGLGTLNGLDGEMIAIDGRFFRADVNGDVTEIEPSRLTPFAVVIGFEPVVRARLAEPLDFDGLKAFVDGLGALDEEHPACAMRLDGEFEHLHLRSVPSQEPPYPSLLEVAAHQNEFEIAAASGSLVGFRFPAWAEGVELAGWHLHFIDDERRRGGHVLDVVVRSGELAIDPSEDLHLELPSGVELPTDTLGGKSSQALHEAE